MLDVPASHVSFQGGVNPQNSQRIPTHQPDHHPRSFPDHPVEDILVVDDRQVVHTSEVLIVMCVLI